MSKIIKFIKDKSNNLKKFIKNKEYIDLLKENILFTTYLLTIIISSTLLRIICMPTIDTLLSIKAIFADLAVAMFLGSFVYLLKPKNRFTYLMICEIFLCAVCMINSIYFTFYTSFASISMLSLTHYLKDVGDAVVYNVLQPKDIIYIIGPIVLFLVYKKNKGKEFTKYETKKEKRTKFIKTIYATILVSILFLIQLTPLDISRFIKQWNKEYVVKKYGIYVYQANDLVTSLKPKLNSLFGADKAKKDFIEYFSNKEKETKNEYSDIFKGKNVIVIHGESMMLNAMKLKFNGREVTPNLNRLAKEGLFFSNFYSQVSVGTSSDAELTFNTSLMPTKSGTAFVSYSDRTYLGLPKYFNDLGYYTYSMHANNGNFWNRKAMHAQLGYKKFFDKSKYKVDKENIIGLGLSDKEFFKQSIDKMKKINDKNKNWYGLLIMLSNHTPFSATDKYGEFKVDMEEEITKEDGTKEKVTYPYMEGTKLGNYFKSLHYADEALGEFMKELENAGLLENTVFVLYGDHDARLPHSDYNRLYNYDKVNDKTMDKTNPEYKEYDSYDYEIGRRVPFLIWTNKSKDNKKLNREITDVMGMYDVAPTLANMFGFNIPYAIGHDIFNIKENNVVIFPNGNWVNNKVYYNTQKNEYKALGLEVISEEEIRKNIKETEKKLDISNDIIVYNLLKEHK
jgi:hypothetical protein